MTKRQYSKNRINKPRNVAGILFMIGLILSGTLLTALAFAYEKLEALWLEQCEITDPIAQAEVISTGKMVLPDTIRDKLGIVKGANLWKINFKTTCAECLENYPTIRSISVSKRLPKQVIINVVEREPVVRMGISGQKAFIGRVADSEGVVFRCGRNVDMLPIIREASAPGTAPGQRLSGNALAALRLLEASRDAEFQELGILQVDASKPDYLLVTLGNYQLAKVAWDGMDNPSPRTQDKMLRVMRNLRDAINARLTGTYVLWNATEPDRVYADTKEPIK